MQSELRKTLWDWPIPTRYVVLSTLALCIGGLTLLASPVRAQRLRDIPQVVEAIYEVMPQLPQENNYQTPEGETIVSSSWLQRVLLYHIRTQGRLPDNYFDWKLTFADYLEANVPMFASAYPGADQFTENPLNRDRDLFQTLSREDRNQLLSALLDIYGITDLKNPLQLSEVTSASLLETGDTDGDGFIEVGEGAGNTNDGSEQIADSDDARVIEGETVQLEDSGPGSADLLRLD